MENVGFKIAHHKPKCDSLFPPLIMTGCQRVVVNLWKSLVLLIRSLKVGKFFKPSVRWKGLHAIFILNLDILQML